MKAWDVALPTMQEGEKCVLYCHYSYAYGFSGLSPLVRPNTNCLFEIELLRFEGLTQLKYFKLKLYFLYINNIKFQNKSKK